jgi:hypothetical protein
MKQSQLSQAWLDDRKKKLDKLSKNISLLKGLIGSSSSFDPYSGNSSSSPDVEHSDIWYEFDNLEKELDSDITLLDTMAVDDSTSPSSPDDGLRAGHLEGSPDSDEMNDPYAALLATSEFGTGNSPQFTRRSKSATGKRVSSRGRDRERDRVESHLLHYHDDSDLYSRPSSKLLHNPRRSSSPPAGLDYNGYLFDDENVNSNNPGRRQSSVAARRPIANVKPVEAYALRTTSLDEHRSHRFGSRPPESEARAASAAGGSYRGSSAVSSSTGTLYDRDHYLMRADLNIAAARQQRSVKQQLDSAAVMTANTKSEFETHAK